MDNSLLIQSFELMTTAKSMAELFEERKDICAKYVHATSRGHEAIQIAVGLQLKQFDFVFPYYRDDAMMLAMGFTPKDLMLQLLAKGTDYFSGGRTYYCHPSSNRLDLPKIPHQSSATGMQVIPATGAAQGIQYKAKQGINFENENSLVLCSLGDGAITEGEVSEALQMAALHQYPIIYLVQDNEWDISAHSSEIRAQDASEYALGFKGIKVFKCNGSDIIDCFNTTHLVFDYVRTNRKPALFHVKVPLLNHHTSGVRKEWYRPQENLLNDANRDPYIQMIKILKEKLGFTENDILFIEEKFKLEVISQFESALKEPDPSPNDLISGIFIDTEVIEETGERTPLNGQVSVMVDAALHAVDEILKKHPESLLYGQDVGGELGGVFREAATLAKKYGDNRVFNTPIQEAYIIGSTVGMSAVGCKPIVEVQFADYIFPGINQLFTEVSRSCYLSNGKWPVSAVYRVPIGAYGSGGPYHSSSVESFVLQIKGIKVVYPSNAADMKGLMKAAFYDPNPVLIFEHKGLYWSKVQGTQEAKCIEPDENYIIPIGKARLVQSVSDSSIRENSTIGIITYGMGVYWALNASKEVNTQVEILDLRSLNPLDNHAIDALVKRHGKIMVLTEETVTHSFAEALAGRISTQYFEKLDAPISIVGAENTPAIPLNEILEKTMLPNTEKVKLKILELINY